MLEPILEADEWQMTLGERAALEGVLGALGPRIAIEIGTDQGGSLARIAAHSEEVHSFDLEHSPELSWPGNAVLHSGDSHELLPAFLATLAEEGQNVDFVLVDGDHTAEGVRQDLEDLLASPAIGRSVIVVHDTLNDEVRRGVCSARICERPEAVLHDPDFVAGHLSSSGHYENHLWGGLGLILVDREGGAFAGAEAGGSGFEDAFTVFADFRDRRVAAQRMRRWRLPRRGRSR